MSLKEALRQIKSDPKVYKKFKETLNDLNNEERVQLIQYSKNKEDYLKLLSEDGYSKNIIARESRLWDQNDGKFKQGKLPGEESQHPMYDPMHSSLSDDFKEFVDIAPEFQEKLKGLTQKEAKKVWSDYVKSEEGKLTTNILKAYRKNENNYFNELAKSKGAEKSEIFKGNYKNSGEVLNFENSRFANKIKKPEELATFYMVEHGKVPSLAELREYGSRFFSHVDVTQQGINAAKELAKKNIQKSKFHNNYAQLYKDLGVEIPVYVPKNVSLEDITKTINTGSLSKIKPSLDIPEEGFAKGGAVQMEKGGKAKRKEPSPFDGLEPTFGDRMGTWVSDKVTEGAINLYDKLAKRDRMSAAHKIYLDTFARDIRDPITAKDFNTEELSELQNLIRQKEKTLGGKGKGYIEYKDYTELTGGDRRKAYGANLIGGVLPPRPSLAKSLGQFNYELDPTTKQYRIIDEYDFNPQQIEYQGRKVDVPVEHYGDYLGEGSLYALARLYGGRKMPPGTGRKVELSVPYAKGGEVEVGSSPLDQRLLELAYKLFRHDKYKSDKYPSNIDSVVSPSLPWDQKITEMPGDFKFNTLRTDIGDEIINNPFKPNDMDEMTKDWDEMGLRRLEKIKKRYYAEGGAVEFNPDEIDMMAAQLIEEQNG
jgi:hypothetical protein